MIGICFITEVIDYEIGNKKKQCEKVVDVVYGDMRTGENGVQNFIPLSGKFLGYIIPRGKRDEKICVFGFRDFNEIIEEYRDNRSGVLLKCYDDFRKEIGSYWEYNAIKNKMIRIKDKNIKKIIENSGDYDVSVLSGKSDISDMYSTIKETIIGQDEQIMQILTSIFKNQKVINSNLDNDMIAKLKENIIIYGSTGTGKTEILKRISKIYDVPIVIQDSTSLSETGYVGRNISDMLNDLYLAAGSDIEKAEKGILVIDEFDKLAEKGQTKDHVSRMGVQRSLLKLLDGTEFYIDGKKFDTSKLSIVALGAFMGIAKDDNYSEVKTTDFVSYGIMRELMGRFSKTIAMNSLTKEDIKRILVESNFSPLYTYKKLFETMGIGFEYDESFVDYVADKAVALQSGARSLKTIFDNEIGSAMFRIFAGEYKSIKLKKPVGEGKAYELTIKDKQDIKKGNKR